MDNLKSATKALYAHSQEERDVNRLILQHLEFYEAALAVAGLKERSK